MTASARPLRPLDEKFTLDRGRVLLSGNEALVRMMLMQKARDRAHGLNTAGFVSGYRGSPLGRLDREFEKAGDLLARNDIVFRPGLNEDLAATAVWGTQQLGLFPGARYDGVFSMWYGKGPGVDRSMDVIRHAQASGTAPHGGTLLLVGDDHGAVSSTLPHQSEHNLISAMVPLLSPAGVGEFLDFGLLGWAMSRFSGSWVGFKCQTEIVESTMTVEVDPLRPAIVVPDRDRPAAGLGIRWPDGPSAQERRLFDDKMAAVLAFARANRLNRVTMGQGRARIGVVASGKAWLDLQGALALLGIDETRAGELGLRLYKVGLVWPLEPEGLDRFVAGLETVLVVEEKRPVIETELKSHLFNRPAGQRPLIVGKAGRDGAPLLPAWGEINPLMIARALLQLIGPGNDALSTREALLGGLEEKRTLVPPAAAREPYFCAGCPHSISTRVPEGSRASTGIGCHMMVIGVPERSTATFTQMGGEGVAWTGMAPFTDERHIFVNMGDGTYFHSGLLAIRAAVAARVNATYKILFNDAVAMTGGQRHDGELTVPDLVRQLQAEGVRRVEVVAEDPDRWLGHLPGVTLSHRDDLDEVQRRLREIPGVTAIVFDQVCAAEKRRRRKRGTLEAGPRRAFINELVCEGCGDCSAVSNCIAVEPVETPFGRKRRINQSNCNTDLSCIKGFCPSFVTVEGAVPRRRRGGEALDPAAISAGLPEPVLPGIDGSHAMLLAGIGGTGVLTVSAILAQAAHLDGIAVLALDQTGLAQKNGAVLSHLRFAQDPSRLSTIRIGRGEADVLLGFDLVTATGAVALQSVARGRTRVVVDAHVAPTAAFVKNNAVDIRGPALASAVGEATGAPPFSVDATDLASRLLGDAIGANMLVLGFAWQHGLVPCSREAIESAIELNGVAVPMNRLAFALGRLAAHDGAAPVLRDNAGQATAPESTEDRLRRRASFLRDYQDDAYARRFEDLVARTRAAEHRLGARFSGLAETVSENAFRLMSYKDEYEVSRLHTLPAFRQSLAAAFEGPVRLRFHLAPPLMSRTDPRTGHPAKVAFGAWMLPVFRLLAKLRRLRGTPFDVFGRTDERRMERRLIEDYVGLVEEITEELTPANHAAAVRLAGWPSDIRGFGHVKLAAVRRAEERRETLVAEWRRAGRERAA